ncbi:hypothetical protein AAC387_Pa01g0585 [Persea americana]
MKLDERHNTAIFFPLSSATGISTTPPPAPAEMEACTNIYPSSLATYEEVSASPELFMETLEKLRKSIGTKFICRGITQLALFDLVKLQSSDLKACGVLSMDWQNRPKVTFVLSSVMCTCKADHVAAAIEMVQMVQDLELQDRLLVRGITSIRFWGKI